MDTIFYTPSPLQVVGIAEYGLDPNAIRTELRKLHPDLRECGPGEWYWKLVDEAAANLRRAA